MSLQLLLLQTRERFPHRAESGVEILPIEKGGSDRLYYRVRLGADFSLILVKYNLQKEENTRFVGIANFLNVVGVNAPLIYFHDPEEGLIWMQDLGETDLWHYRQTRWAIRRKLYESTLEQMARLHGVDLASGENLGLQAGFGEKLYLWEQEYCFQNCLQLCFRLSDDQVQALRSNPAFRTLAMKLASYPRVLIHRDFQSQNVILWDDEPYLIDFQGMRAGLAQYDLASLLFDPYTNLTREERGALLRYYFERTRQNSGFSQFERIFFECALQRLMQALGAYGVISMIRGKPEFLRHIKPAMKSLIEVASSIEEFSFLADFLARLPQPPNSSTEAL
jgi:N-acetylmuramate 1-kinase